VTPDIKKPVSLETEVDHVIEESRMVLPGIQALFGFQLIAVFNERFDIALPAAGRWMHSSPSVLIAFAIALIMPPAAFHRQAQRGFVSGNCLTTHRWSSPLRWRRPCWRLRWR
jgi:hypothetical protein